MTIPTDPMPLFGSGDGSVPPDTALEGRGGTMDDAQRRYALARHGLDFALLNFEKGDDNSVFAHEEVHAAHETLADARSAMQEFGLSPFRNRNKEGENND